MSPSIPNTIPNALRKTSSMILLVFQFMQCCLVPDESISGTPAATPYSSVRGQMNFPATRSSLTPQSESMESECVTLHNCPLFCDESGPSHELDLPGFASISRT